jgi:uncharacterized membrane protein YgcG
VILSGVRCNEKNDIGFVKNPNRMNVAISRMKCRLTVVGSNTTLCTNDNWATLFKTSKVVDDIEEIPLLPPLPNLPRSSVVSQSYSVSEIMAACPRIEKELYRQSQASDNEHSPYSGKGVGRGRGGKRGGGRGGAGGRGRTNRISSTEWFF